MGCWTWSSIASPYVQRHKYEAWNLFPSNPPPQQKKKGYKQTNQFKTKWITRKDANKKIDWLVQITFTSMLLSESEFEIFQLYNKFVFNDVLGSNSQLSVSEGSNSCHQSLPDMSCECWFFAGQ